MQANSLYSFILDWFRRFRFPVLLNLTLIVLILFYQGSLQSAVFGIVLFFVPGFIVSKKLFSNPVLSTIAAYPLSVSIVAGSIFFFSHFYAYAINLFSLILAYFIAVLISFFVRKNGDEIQNEMNAKEYSPYLEAGLLLVVVLAFFMHTTFVGKGSYSNDYPIGVMAWDKSVQLSWVDWMSQSGQTSLPPWLHEGKAGVESVYLTPNPLFLTGLFARFSNMSFWDAQNLFSSLIFVFAVLGVFFLANYFFSPEIGFFSSLAAAMPLLYYFNPDIAGMLRVPVMVFLGSFLWVMLDLMVKRVKSANWIGGILAGGFLLAHPVSLPMVLVPALFIFLTIKIFPLNKKDLLYFAVFIATSLALFLPLYVVAERDYISSLLFSDFSLINPLAFDEKSESLVGPILLLKNYWPFLLIGLMVGLFILWREFREKRISVHDKEFRFIANGLFMILFTTGFTSFYFHYSGKLRFASYLLILVPLLVWGIVHVAGIVSKSWKMFPRVLGILFVLFLVGNPWTVEPNKNYEKVDSVSWEVLQWLDANTPSHSTALAILGFYQHSSILGKRVGNYVGANDNLLEYLNGKDISFPEYCIPGFKRNMFYRIEFLPCVSPQKRLEDYDYLLADYLATNGNAYWTKSVKNGLNERGFKPVFQREEIIVYENVLKAKVIK